MSQYRHFYNWDLQLLYLLHSFYLGKKGNLHSKKMGLVLSALTDEPYIICKALCSYREEMIDQ